MAFLDLAHVNVMRGTRQVLYDISLHIAEGEQVVLLGPNGCGKSTLLKVMTCELYPVAAPETSVSILGRERWDLTELKQRLGVVQNELPGKPILKCTALEAVLTGFFSSSTLWPNLKVTVAMRAEAEQMLQRIGATALRDRYFGELSAGQQQRVLIGRALIASAGCLLLDEPSNALDIYSKRELRALLADLAAQGTTLIQITHNIADIGADLRRVVMMREGRIFADGHRGQLLTEDRLSDLFQTRVRLLEHDGVLHAW